MAAVALRVLDGRPRPFLLRAPRAFRQRERYGLGRGAPWGGLYRMLWAKNSWLDTPEDRIRSSRGAFPLKESHSR